MLIIPAIFRKTIFILVCGLALPCSDAFSAEVPKVLQDVSIVEHLGERVPVESLKFKDELGKDVLLKEFFHPGQPVILNLVYYGCPNLCTLVLNGLVRALKTLEWTPGKEFQIVTLSIDPSEGAALAAKKKEAYLASYGRKEAAAGWHFLTGDADEIRSLADRVGFRFSKDPSEPGASSNTTNQFAHSAAIFVLTPDGTVSRYLYGIEYPKKDLQLALIEASGGKVGAIIDRVIMFCYRYDPHTGRYSVYLNRLMGMGGAAMVLAFGGYLAVFWRRQAQGANLFRRTS
jgi:protein SCO1/2